MSTLATYLKLGAATAIVGAIVGGAISFTLPRRYVSDAVMRFTPEAVPAEPAWQIGFAVARNLQEMREDLEPVQPDRNRPAAQPGPVPERARHPTHGRCDPGNA
jgi:uncharacterized protein involved in exopolysaccharide biosynthesis